MKTLYWVSLAGTLAAACTPANLELIVNADDGASDAGALLQVKVEVQWNQSTGKQSRPEQYGLTLVHGSDPSVFGAPGNATYKENLAKMRPGSIRFAGELLDDASQSGGWVQNAKLASASWDEAKIAQALKNDQSTIKMITIARWPTGFGTADQPLPDSFAAPFAKFCADLVRITNTSLGKHVRYFEVLNELEDVYKDQGGKLGTLVAQAAVAMKAVDPSIHVGGAGFINAYAPELPDFIAAAGDAIDFVSYHGYATGDANASLMQIFDAGLAIASQTDRLAALGSAKLPGLQVLQTQWNINWNRDERMNNHVGAVFDALALTAFARSNTVLATAWNEADGWYGKLDDSFTPRLSAHVFRLFNERLVGNIMTTTVSEPQAVTAMAVLATGRRRVVLINRSLAPRQVTAGAGLAFAATRTTISEQGVAETSFGKETTAFVLPGLSVTVLSEP